MHRPTARVLLTAITLSTGFTSAHGAAPPSIHSVEYAREQHTLPVLSRRGYAVGRDTIAEPATTRFGRTVYGYYPYWVDEESELPWEHLTHLAYFCVSVNADGSLGDDHDWSTRGAALVTAGHSQGVAVVLTATMFDSDDIGVLLANAGARRAAIDNLLTLVNHAGGDGLNIDFEFVPSSPTDASGNTPKENFVTFISDLTTAFHAVSPTSHVSLATPAVDWGGTYDYDALAEASDGLMIMGYGYHWSGGDPGPGSPIDGGEIWGRHNLTWTIQDYLTWGGDSNRDRFILGLPLYGRDWPSIDLTVPGTATEHGDARSLSACDVAFEDGKLWDEAARVPYKLYMDGNQAHQLFCEDTASLTEKFQLIVDYDLGGVMFWDVGKASAQHQFWSQVDQHFGTEATNTPSESDPGDNSPPIPSVSVTPQSTLGSTLALDATASTDPDGDLLSFHWRAIEGPAVEIANPQRANATTVLETPGHYRFRFEVNDGQISTLADVTVHGTPAPSLELPEDTEAGGCRGTPAAPAILLLAAMVLGRYRRRPDGHLPSH